MPAAKDMTCSPSLSSENYSFARRDKGKGETQMCKPPLRHYSGLMVFYTLCLSLFSTPGAAFAPQWTVDRDNPDGSDFYPGTVVIWHVGGSVSTSSMQAAVIEVLCAYTSDPVDILEDARSYIVPPNPGGATDMEKAGVARPAFWSVACIGKGHGSFYPSLTGRKLIWNTREEGGSGVGHVALGKPIGFMKPTTPFGSDSPYDVNCPGNGFFGTRNYTRSITFPNGYSVNATVWNCINFTYSLDPPVAATIYDGSISYGDAVMRVPDISSTDIEPQKYTFAHNVPQADFNLDAVIDATDALPAFDISFPVIYTDDMAYQIFSTPMNTRMYQDVQRAQFPIGHPLYNGCNPAGATYGSITSSTTNANSEKCMPSLTANEIRSIFMAGGAVRSSQDFQAETTYGSGTYAELSATVNGATDNTIQICRYANGAGAQAQFNAIFLGYPCDPNGDGTIDTLMPESAGVFTPFVVNNYSSADLEKCLNDFNNGTNATGKNPGLKKRWAIGILSLDKNAPSVTTGLYSNDYRFPKIDGYAPTLANVHAGDYLDFTQWSLQYNAYSPQVTEEAFDSLVSFGLLDGDALKLPALNKTHAFGVSGWLGSPRPTQTPDAVLNLSRPVSWYRHVTSLGKTNACARPSMFKKGGGSSATVGPQNCSANGGADNNCYTP